MKKLIFILLFPVLIFMMGCSKDNDTGNPSNPTPGGGKYRLSKITLSDGYGECCHDSLFYYYFDNNKIKLIKYSFSETYNGNTTNYVSSIVYHYNDQGLVDYYIYIDDDNDSYNVSCFYENKKLIKFLEPINGDELEANIVYNGEKLTKVNCTFLDIENFTVELTYDGNNVIKQTSNCPGNETEVSYEFDDKTNPFYSMGLMPVISAGNFYFSDEFLLVFAMSPYNFISISEITPICKNNTTKEIIKEADGNTTILEWDYNYNDNGLPSNAIFKENGELKYIFDFHYEKAN